MQGLLTMRSGFHCSLQVSRRLAHCSLGPLPLSGRPFAPQADSTCRMCGRRRQDAALLRLVTSRQLATLHHGAPWPLAAPFLTAYIWQTLALHCTEDTPCRGLSLKSVSCEAFSFSVFSKNQEKTKPLTWWSVSSEDLQSL